MNPPRSKFFLPLFLLITTIPIYLTGCAGANTLVPSETTSSTSSGSSTGNANSSSTGGTVDSNSPSSGSSTSTSGTSTSDNGNTTSGTGTTTVSTGGTGSSDSGDTSSTGGTGSSDSGNTASTGGTGSSDSGDTASTGGTGSSDSGSGTSGSGSGTPSTEAIAPLSALKVAKMQLLSNWDGVYDTGTGSSSSTSVGQMSLTSSPSHSGMARKFVTNYTNNGGERYWVSFGSDTATTNFLYDAWIYLDDSSGSIANIELDMNQVMSNGQTVIYGVQCDGWSGTWDYTVNNGTPANPKGAWVHVKAAPCNPRQWKRYTWHHVQITYSRDDAGNVTYKSVWLDGEKQDLNATVPSAFALGWRTGTLLTNFQVDGLGTSGTATVYLDDLTIYRW